MNAQTADRLARIRKRLAPSQKCQQPLAAITEVAGVLEFFEHARYTNEKGTGITMKKSWKTLGAVALVSVGVLMNVGVVLAESTTGPVLRLREGRDSGRVSVQMSKANDPCPQHAGWYAYEDANGSERLRTELLIAAYSAGRNVTINGTGQCDAFGVETIDFIDIE